VNPELEKALAISRWWRDRGNDLLIVFLIFEFVLELWPDISHKWSPWNPPKRYKIRLQQYSRFKRGLTILAALMVVLGVGIERHEGNKSDDKVDRIRAIQQARIADAVDRATDAQQDATQSEVLIAELNSDAQAAQLEQEKLKRDNLNLAKALQPRRVGTTDWNGVILTGGLDRFTDTPVLIQSVPDWESTRLAADIAGVLSKFGWKPSFVDASTTTVGLLAIPDGVQIFTVRDEFVLRHPPQHPGTEAQTRSALAAETLSKYLQIFNVENVHRGLTRPWVREDAAPPPFAPQYSAPDDAVIVLVGRNVDWQTQLLVLSNVNASTDIKQLLELKEKGPFPFGWGWQ
jgi:hypothetical protein